MLALLGFCMMGIFLFLVMKRYVSVFVAFIFVAFGFAVISGHGAEMGEMMMDGIITVTPTALMIIFAILYFGLMIDVGLFDPMISQILKLVKGDPLKIVLATAIITMIVALDGDGSSVFMISVSAMLPIYTRLGMNRLILACVVSLAAGVMNIIPWGGPMLRAAASLQVEINDLFLPIIPVMLVGLGWVLVTAYILGMKERKRLGIAELDASAVSAEHAATIDHKKGIDKKYWFNLVLTMVLIALLVMNILPVPLLFAAAFALALFVNFPDPAKQQEMILSHSKNVVTISTLVFAAGIFIGVFSESGMMGAMADTMVAVIPDWLGAHLAFIVALTAVPLCLVFSPDSYYFGILPILSEMGSSFGIAPEEIGIAALLGHSTVGFPLSPLVPATFILIGLVKVGFGEHQKFLLKYALLTNLVMTIAAVFLGVIPL